MRISAKLKPVRSKDKKISFWRCWTTSVIDSHPVGCYAECMAQPKQSGTLRSVAWPSFLILALSLVLLGGCTSPYIDATVTNQTGTPIMLLEVDYPSASFGRDVLTAGASFSYRFKTIDNDKAKISWTDASRHVHKSTGPMLKQGQRGSLQITILSTSAEWSAHLTPQ